MREEVENLLLYVRYDVSVWFMRVDPNFTAYTQICILCIHTSHHTHYTRHHTHCGVFGGVQSVIQAEQFREVKSPDEVLRINSFMSKLIGAYTKSVIFFFLSPSLLGIFTSLIVPLLVSPALSILSFPSHTLS